MKKLTDFPLSSFLSFSFPFLFLFSLFLLSFPFLSLFSPFLSRISLTQTYLPFMLNSHLSPLCMNLTHGLPCVTHMACITCHVSLTWHVLHAMCPTCVTMTQVLMPCVTHDTCTMPCVTWHVSSCHVSPDTHFLEKREISTLLEFNKFCLGN